MLCGVGSSLRGICINFPLVAQDFWLVSLLRIDVSGLPCRIVLFVVSMLFWWVVVFLIGSCRELDGAPGDIILYLTLKRGGIYLGELDRW